MEKRNWEKTLHGFIAGNIILMVALIAAIVFTVQKYNKLDLPEELEALSHTQAKPDTLYCWKGADSVVHVEMHYYKK